MARAGQYSNPNHHKDTDMYPIVTAHQAFDDGIHPGELFRAARCNANFGKHAQAAAIRRVGFELAGIMGMRLHYRGAANNNGKRRRAA